MDWKLLLLQAWNLNKWHHAGAKLSFECGTILKTPKVLAKLLVRLKIHIVLQFWSTNPLELNHLICYILLCMDWFRLIIGSILSLENSGTWQLCPPFHPIPDYHLSQISQAHCQQNIFASDHLLRWRGNTRWCGSNSRVCYRYSSSYQHPGQHQN